jgi:hypothetical protein
MDQTVGIVLEFAGVPAGMGVIRYTGCEKVLSHAAEGGLQPRRKAQHTQQFVVRTSARRG